MKKQVVDGNWGVHAIIKKSLIARGLGGSRRLPTEGTDGRISTEVRSVPNWCPTGLNKGTPECKGAKARGRIVANLVHPSDLG